MRSIKKIPDKPYTKGFNMGWGRALGCVIHYFEEHLHIEALNLLDVKNPIYMREDLIEYMNSLREKQLRRWDSEFKEDDEDG